MAKYSSSSVAFFLHSGHDLLGVSTDLSDTVEGLTEDATVLGATWQTPLPTGTKRAELTQAGYFDNAADSSHHVFNEQQGTSRVVSLGYEGNTLGKNATCYAGAYASKYSRIVSKNQLHRAAATYQITGASDECAIIAPLAARTADGNTQTTPWDNAVLSTNGAGYLQVNAITLSGRPSVVIKLRHSDDNSTYADLATFAAVSAIGAERVAITGTINRYVAIAWAWGGSGGTPSVTAAVMLNRA